MCLMPPPAFPARRPAGIPIAALELTVALSLLLISRLSPIATLDPAALLADALILLGTLWISHSLPVAAIALASGYAIWFAFPDLYPSVMMVATYLVVFTLVRTGHSLAPVAAGLVLVANLTLLAAKGLAVSGDYAAFCVLLAVAWVGGVIFRNLDRRLAAVQDQRRESLRRLRMSLAAELHDTVAQTQTLIVLRAEDALELPDLPEAVREELRGIVRTTRQAIHDLRVTMAVLRDVDGDFGDAVVFEAAPLAEAIEREEALLRQAGFEPSIHVDVDANLLDGATGQAASRILVELASNIRWHGVPGPCVISVSEAEEGIELLVINRPAGTSAKAGGGLGLLGVKERARLHGGTADVQRSVSQWRVRVHLPVAA